MGDLVKSLGGSKTNLLDIQTALGEYLKGFDSNNSAPVGFHVENMTALGWSQSNLEIWSDLRESRLRLITQEYRRAASWLIEANAILTDTDIRSPTLDAGKKAKIKAAAQLVEASLSLLAQSHSACKLASSADPDACKFSPIERSIFATFDPAPALPQGSYVGYINGEQLDPAVVQLLPWGAGEDFRTSARKIVPNYSNSRLSILAVGKGLKAARVVFVSSSQCAGAAASVIDFQALNSDRAEVPLFVDGQNLEGIVSKIFTRILQAQSSEACSGSFVWEIIDQFDRKSQIRFMDAQWSSTGNQGIAQRQITLLLQPL